jgi:hypothetical protein
VYVRKMNYKREKKNEREKEIKEKEGKIAKPRNFKGEK